MYFKQIIFESKPKEVVSYDPSYESNKLQYLFEYTLNNIKCKCYCPVCGIQYIYATLSPDTIIADFIKSIEDNYKFYKEEFSVNCPDIKEHNMVNEYMEWYRAYI